MEFWGIKSGDEVLMELSKLKRHNLLSRKSKNIFICFRVEGLLITSAIL